MTDQNGQASRVLFFSNVILGSRMRGTAVEYMPNHPTVKGLSPAAEASTGREKLEILFKCSSFY
jgi:hypothetical protein